MSDARTRTVGQLEEQLGRNVRAVRIAQDMSQSELADHANVSLGAVRSLEKGRGSTVTTLVKVLRTLGQESWIDALGPPARTFNPLDLLDTQGSRPRRGRDRQRVSRARRPTTRPG